jgi:hypothetical protein
MVKFFPCFRGKKQYMKKKEKLNIVRQHYPNALTTPDTVNRMFDIIARAHGM